MEWCLLWGYAVGGSLCSSGEAHPAYQWLSIAKGAFFLSCSISSETCCSPEQLSSSLCLWTRAASTCGSRILTQGFQASLAKVESTWGLWKGFPLLPSGSGTRHFCSWSTDPKCLGNGISHVPKERKTWYWRASRWCERVYKHSLWTKLWMSWGISEEFRKCTWKHEIFALLYFLKITLPEGLCPPLKVTKFLFNILGQSCIHV